MCCRQSWKMHNVQTVTGTSDIIYGCLCLFCFFKLMNDWQNLCSVHLHFIKKIRLGVVFTSYTNRKILLIWKWNMVGWLWTKLHETLFWKVWTFKTIQSVLISLIIRNLCVNLFWGRKRPFTSRWDQLTGLIWLVGLWTYVFMVNTWPHTAP